MFVFRVTQILATILAVVVSSMVATVTIRRVKGR